MTDKMKAKSEIKMFMIQVERGRLSADEAYRGIMSKHLDIVAGYTSVDIMKKIIRAYNALNRLCVHD